jgi:SAM-dependent methyltransferase
MDIREWFEESRKRGIAPVLNEAKGVILNLGSGHSPMPQPVINLDRSTGWDADLDPLPCEDNTVGAIYMHGFIDYVIDPVALLRECERVLVRGGVINIVTPHAMSELGSSDIHKKTRWTEESFPHLLHNEHYDPPGGDLKLMVQTQFIMGIVWRNLSLFTQLIRTVE